MISFEEFCEKYVQPPIKLNKFQKEYIKFLSWAEKNNKQVVYPYYYRGSKTYMQNLLKEYYEQRGKEEEGTGT